MTISRLIPSRAGTHLFELHDIAANHMLAIGPRHHTPVSDDLVFSVAHRTFGTSTARSVRMSRAQVRECVEWLNRWLEHGWPAVTRVEGPTSADVIDHHRHQASAARHHAEKQIRDAGRRLGSALILIPEQLRTVELDGIAVEEGRIWKRMAIELEQLQQIRMQLIHGLFLIRDAEKADAGQLRKAAAALLRSTQHPDLTVSEEQARAEAKAHAQRILRKFLPVGGTQIPAHRSPA